jgi:hypothetical protein
MADVPSTPSDGNVRISVVTTIADTENPTVAELNAGTSVDISCYLTGDGWAPGGSQATVEDRRLCSVQIYGTPGTATYSLELTYIENPQSATDNDAFDALDPGTDLYIVERRGIAYDTAFAAAQKVTIHPVTPGIYRQLPPEQDSQLKVAQTMFYWGDKVTNVAVDA